MIKRTILAVGVVGLLGMMVFGRDMASYVCTGASRARDAVRSGVPIEFEIARARDMVEALVPDIRRNMHVIAKEEVEIEALKEQIAQSESKLDKQQGEIVQLRDDLSQGQSTYHYAGRKYTTKQVKADLANRFERYKTNEATLASLQDLCAAREKSLLAAQQKLDGMLAAKRQLEVDVENLSARLKMVEVAQTTSEFNFDDSRLARVKDLMSDIRTRLNVAEKLVNSDHQYQGEIILDESTSNDDIADRVTEYFEGHRAPATVAEVAAD